MFLILQDFETALHIAVVSKHPAMVALLLSYGNREALTKENKVRIILTEFEETMLVRPHEHACDHIKCAMCC